MSTRLATAVVASLGILLLQAACARSVDGDVPEDHGFSPTNPAPLTACVETNCPAPWASCTPGELCTTDTSHDLDNCGGCNIQCPALQKSLHATPLCSKGACAFACAPLFANCNGDFADGCEVSVADDPKNCGGCGKQCGEGEICWRGACGCPNGMTVCDGTECKNLQTDQDSCGACDKKCQAPDTSSPEWKCGPGVQPPQTEWGCSGGGCHLTCKGSFGDCNDDLCKDGCETSLDSDPLNCGACGHACDANQECVHGTCLCPPGTVRCGDICVDTSVDPNNCGACGNGCPGASDSSANGGPTCSGGHCGYVCFPGFVDCNKNIVDGCEANLANDPKHCGGCGTKCDLAHGQPCVGGVCLTKPCDAPEAAK
jgi:hypothetical protein